MYGRSYSKGCRQLPPVEPCSINPPTVRRHTDLEFRNLNNFPKLSYHAVGSRLRLDWEDPAAQHLPFPRR